MGWWKLLKGALAGETKRVTEQPNRIIFMVLILILFHMSYTTLPFECLSRYDQDSIS